MRARDVLLALTLCVATTAAAAAPDAVREHFRTLLEAAERGELPAREDALAELADYPLYPYLTAADLTWRLRRDGGTELDTRIGEFIDAHPALPPAQTLRRRWVRDLADRGRWDAVLAHTADSDGTALQCLAMQARIRTRAAPPATLTEQALDFWRAGHSQPDTCDRVFEWLDERGALDNAEIMRRAELALEAGNSGLAGYLGRKLSGDAADRMAGWLHLVRNPGDLHHATDLPPDVAVAAFKRLALRDLEAAAALEPELARRLDLPPEARHEMQRYIALLHAQDHDERALAWFERLAPEHLDTFARGWRIRSALYHGRWQLALDWIEALPPDERAEEEWRYWRARALDALGREAEAAQGFAALAGERSYHGYLAADALDRDYSFNRNPLERDPALRHALLKRPGIQRAHELFALDMRHRARREWDAVLPDLSAAELRQAALLAHDWGWHQRAVVTLVRADYWDDLDIRYPLVHREAVEAAARETGVEAAYILAIIRTESLFAPDARSSAGALGLMQIMPPTARRVALDRPAPTAEDLLEPATSIELGSRYLERMRERFGGHPALASAAYNAGPGRVSDWLPERTLPADLWIANIPYTETREYVQRAMSHMTVFEARLGGGVSRLSERLPPVPAELSADCRPRADTC
ncbi:lytic transglycosylase catalytic subunit subunit [Salinisphaera sp. PC39]|uniref:transglycosylase SLT domain-containing protein n=1 Tax=Salinisphaera sp. PC39 TaxID=1304156 RepID=UPI0033408BB1